MRKSLWDRMAKFYDKLFRAMYGKVFEVLFPLFDASDNVVEVGCGSGLVSFEVIPRVTRFVGYDLSPDMIQVANEKLAATNFTNATFTVGNALELSDTGLFDKVLLINVLHVVNSPSDVLTQLAKLCKPNGEVVLLSYCHGEQMKLKDRTLSWIMAFGSKLGLMSKLHRFTFEELRLLATETGYEIVREQEIRDGFPFMLMELSPNAHLA
jgi:ubiquinone/menaquinone biosynthesis C-methylase UbiE